MKKLMLAALLISCNALALDGKAKLGCNVAGPGPKLDRIEWNREIGTLIWTHAETGEVQNLVSAVQVDGTSLPLSQCKIKDQYFPGQQGAPDRYSLYVKCGKGHQVGLTVTDGDLRRGLYMLRLEPVENQVERQMKFLADCE